jgi:hypothetical protein
MSRRSRLAATTTAVAFATTLAGPVAAAPAAKPVPGAWKVVDLFDITAGGRLTVTRKPTVKDLRVTPGTGASTGCGTTPVSVKGPLRMRRATRGGFTSWIVGRSAPSTSDGVKPIPVTVVRGDERLDGRLKVIFTYDNRRTGSGEVTFAGCTLEFDLRKS